MKGRALLNACLLIIVATISVYSTNYTVTKTADTNDGTCDADCSLREAVAAAVADPADDVIGFDGGVFSTPQLITLSGTDIQITSNGTLSILGPGANLLTISGNGASRIITNSALAVTAITGFTFTAGNGASTVSTGRAGAIYNDGGTLTIENSVVTGNTATNGGGLNNANGGALTIINSVVSGNTALTSSGGGMQNFSSGTLVIDRCLFIGNTSNSTTGGGGAQLNGIARISNSTFTGNTAASGGDGGGISSNGSELMLTNVTFSENTAEDQGGGFIRRTTNTNMLVRNSIFSGNTATTDPDVATNASLTSLGNNIVGNAGASMGWIGSDMLSTDPMLGPLADNGGFSMTYLPMTGSPAIDNGQNCVVDLSCAASNPPVAVTADQRGIARPMGGTVDIGAVETLGAASVRGRVYYDKSRFAAGVTLSISDKGGVIGTARTNVFGYFQFSDIPPGATYTINTASKEAIFDPVMVDVNGDVNNLVIVATPMMLRDRSDLKQ